jgi:hypothetical protein
MSKIAVYTIALNEAKHVKRWYESAKDADVLLIADTGSTDDTAFISKSLGIHTYQIDVNPWRFDIARNAALALIPADVDFCISMDMDEELKPGWRDVVEQAIADGINYPTVKVVTARNQDGSIYSHFEVTRAHARHGFYWKYPIHELITPKFGLEVRRDLINLEINHNPDPTKSRSSYLSLLELAAAESPTDWRMLHYLVREYEYSQDWLKLLQTCEKAMKLGEGWDVERASTCMWASKAAWELGLQSLSYDWALRATKEAAHFYEAWHWYAHICHLQGKWHETNEAAKKILVLTRQGHHLVKPEVWLWWGYDLIALSAHKLGNQVEAVQYGEMALQNSPDDTRLQANLGFYKEALDKS